MKPQNDSVPVHRGPGIIVTCGGKNKCTNRSKKFRKKGKKHNDQMFKSRIQTFRDFEELDAANEVQENIAAT